MSRLSEQVEQLEKELKQSNREYEELRELYIAERWELNGFKEERDRVYDTINEYRVEAEDLSILIDELTAERGSAYLKRDIAEDKVEEVEQERDILAYENRSLAEFIKRNDNTLTDSDVGDIACGAPDVWDRFINESAWGKSKAEPSGAIWEDYSDGEILDEVMKRLEVHGDDMTGLFKRIDKLNSNKGN